MNYRLQFVTVFILVAGVVFAQSGDKENTCTNSRFCNKGVPGMCDGKALSLEYELLPNFNLRSSSNQASIGNADSRVSYNKRLRAKFKVPLLNKESLKMMLGFKYFHEDYRFSNVSDLEYDLYRNLDSKNLKTVGTALYIFKAFNSKFYLASKAAVNFSGDYGGFMGTDRKYISYSATSILGVKKSEFLELGFGLSYSNNLGYHFVYPVFVYNQTYNNRWGVEAALPVQAMVRFNAGKTTLLYGGVEMEGANYYINGGRLGNAAIEERLRMNYSEVRFGFKLEQEIVSPLWIGVDVGYRKSLGVNFSRINDGKSNHIIESSPFGGGLYTNFSLFITVPKSLMKKKANGAS